MFALSLLALRIMRDVVVIKKHNSIMQIDVIIRNMLTKELRISLILGFIITIFYAIFQTIENGIDGTTFFLKVYSLYNILSITTYPYIANRISSNRIDINRPVAELTIANVVTNWLYRNFGKTVTFNIKLLASMLAFTVICLY
jgi:hypothetical protein